ncbi:MAG: CPBP family intramembrane metalloprotease [Cellulomonadaceae bacterium]|nr:CPBP family intramembrane metalloprotease [Cellulomonadaceae bacterium]
MPDAPLPAPTTSGTTPALLAPSRGRLRAEVWIVLGLSLGQSAVYAIVRLYARLTAEVALGDQSATLNPTQSPRPYLDLTYQLLGIGFALVPVALALYLLSSPAGLRSTLARIGLDRARPWRDLGVGVGLAALIGIPGIGVYLAGRALGITVAISTSGLGGYWWTVPILILSALQNAVLEEVVVVGYLLERLRELRWSTPAAIAASALLRGAYHLYQGPGMAIGNVAMGVLLAVYFTRTRRVLPLVIAHTLLDVVAFVGYALAPEALLAALGMV